MPGKKISKLGSNLYTNHTCVFGSMPGLNSTVGFRPWITGMHGYKYYRTAANGVNWSTGTALNTAERNAGCGLDRPFGQRCDDGRSCLKFINPNGTYLRFDPVRSKLLG